MRVVVVARESSDIKEPLRQMILGQGLDCGPNDCVSFADLPVRLAQKGTDLVLVRVGEGPADSLEAVRQAVALSRSPVLAFGPRLEAPQVLTVLSGGAREYLNEDDLARELESAVEKLRSAGSVQHGPGLVVAVASATPGSGVSTVATNLAFTWAEKYPNLVALVELGREAPDLALSLDLNPRHTVGELAQNWQRMDASFLKQSMTAHPMGVQVLAHKTESLTADALEPPAVRRAVILMRTVYKASVLDLGHVFGPEHYEAMRLADWTAVVVRLDVPGLRQARRFLRWAAEQGVPRDRVKLVANRYGQRGQIAWRKAEEAIGSPFVEYIPEDAGKLNSALNQGKPLVRAARYAAITRRFARLASLLNGQK